MLFSHLKARRIALLGQAQNLILQSDTVCQFSGGFVMIQADAERRKGLIINELDDV
jgi:hypothetical protein